MLSRSPPPMASPRWYDHMLTDRNGGTPSVVRGEIGQLTSDRFPIDYWLSPRVMLTLSTPYTHLNEFCRRNGFFLSNIGASIVNEDKRVAMFRLLTQLNWPAGYDSFMLARNSKKSAIPIHRPMTARSPMRLPAGGVLGTDLDGASLKSLDMADSADSYDYQQTTVRPISYFVRPTSARFASAKSAQGRVLSSKQVRELQEENESLRASLHFQQAGTSSMPGDVAREVRPAASTQTLGPPPEHKCGALSRTSKVTLSEQSDFVCAPYCTHRWRR